MSIIKDMPNKERYEGVLEYKKVLESFAPQLVNSELGREKMNELFDKWKKESEPIPIDSSDETKYEIAYRNFLQNWVTANRLMTENHGDEGTNKFMKAAIKGWKQKHAATATKLRLMGGISSSTAFKALATQLGYHLQIFSPFTVSELNEDHMVLNIAKCKILDTRKRNDFCLMACQNIIPSWLEEQFNVKMDLRPQGSSCTATFTPF